MKKIIMSLIIGISAGIIDVIPMIFQRLNIFANLSAFIFWVVMGIIISYSSVKVHSWLKGFIISWLCSLPVLILVSENGFIGIVPIMIMTTILGSMVGFLTGKFAK
jgi:hypothetical protein